MGEPRSERRARPRPDPAAEPPRDRRPPDPGSFASVEAARVEERRLAEDAASHSRITRAKRAIRGLAIDTRPLHEHRDFRLLWFGQLISETGHQMTRVAIWIQVFAITGSAAAVGLTGLVELVFLMAATILGGSIVDRFDRRRLLLLTQVAFAGSSLLLLLNALGSNPPVWIVYVGAGLAAGISGIASPTMTAMVPRLVPREQLPNALALNQVMWNATMIVGPAVGGIIIAQVGVQWAYGIDAITYVATITAALLMRPMPPAEGSKNVSGMAAIKEGFAYLKGRPVLQSTFIVDLIAMIFGMPRALFPVLAVQEFNGGAAIVGVMASALAVGAVLGALTTGWVGRIRRQGLAVLIAVGIWGACIVGFGLATGSLWLALLFLAVAGGADVISAVFRGSILQLSVPDRLRGRLSAIHILVVTGGPRLGDFESGIVAVLFTPVASVIIGGVACVAGVIGLGAAVPQFRRWRVGDET